MEDLTGLAKVGEKIDETLAVKIAKLKNKTIKVKPFIIKEAQYLNAIVEDRQVIAHAGVDIDEDLNLTKDFVEARIMGHPGIIEAEKLTYIDVSAKQCISVATALIPFLEHDDANRALMGSNMQRQAVPCIVPQSRLWERALKTKRRPIPAK